MSSPFASIPSSRSRSGGGDRSDSRVRRIRFAAAFAGILAFTFAAFAAAVPAHALDPFPTDFATWHELEPVTPGGEPGAMMSDATGRVWYADGLNNQLVSVDSATGTHVDHVLGAAHPSVVDPVMGPDGNVWFSDSANASVDRFDPRAGTLEVYPLGGPFDAASSLAVGPDGNIWFGDTGSGGIARMTLDGRITRFADPGGALVNHLVSAPDGRLWYTRDGLSSLGAYDPRTGAFDILPIGVSGLSGLAVSSAGDIWVGGTGALAKVALDGSSSIVPIPGPVFEPVVPRSLVAGVAATLYFTDEHQGIGRVDLAGNLTFLRPPFAGSAPSRLAATPAGSLWYTDFSRRTIGWV